MSSAYLCSLDSLFASLALGLLGVSRTVQSRLIVAFALCDSIAMVLGAALHSLVSPSGYAGLILLLAAVSALTCLVAGVWSRRFSTTLVAIPFLLSLDNFITALREGSTVAAGWTVAGLVSGTFAWCGFALAATIMSGFQRVRRFHHV
jgi:putative Mn2+ efflux pump MntP